ncbi:hypothetical protein EHS17_09370 [Rhodobacteraceae bacterium CH30]|nr:hypothetical protein EHS17_09370 [Rhodobacteraceae bacterium CH30]
MGALKVSIFLVFLMVTLYCVLFIGDAMFNKSAVCLCLSVMTLSGQLYAAESAYEDLNSCAIKEQVIMTAKGAGIGALTGFGAALLSGKKDDMVKGALIGAVGGGVAGFATAYYTALETCHKKNPDWIPEAQLERTKSYEQVKKELKYSKKNGLIAKPNKLNTPETIKAGESFDVGSTYYVMTPDGAEVSVVIERRLFIVKDGQETAVYFPVNPKDKDPRVVEPGAYTDSVKLMTPSGLKEGDVLKVEVGISVEGKKASLISKTVKIV